MEKNKRIFVFVCIFISLLLFLSYAFAKDRNIMNVGDDIHPPSISSGEPNNPPDDVNAGPDQTVNEGATVNLLGSATDPDGDDLDLTYSWTQTGGAPLVNLNNSNTANPSFTAPEVIQDTTLTFTLTVKDEDGGSEEDEVVITVKNVNKPPTVNAGPDQTVNENTPVNLSGTGTDPDSDPLTYNWVQTGGSPAVTLNNPNIPNPSFTAPEVTSDAVLTFQLTVNDGKGGTATDTVDVIVKNVVSSSSSNNNGGGGGDGGGGSPALVTQSTPTGKIKGRIINTSGLAVLGTPARIGNTSVATNLNGEFEFSGLSDGIYTVYYEADGYISQTQVLQVSNGGITNAPTVILSPSLPTGRIKGRIINTSGIPILGTPVRINNIRMATNLNGEFEFTFVTDGIYILFYEADGYVSQSQVLVVLSGGTTIAPTVIMSPASSFISTSSTTVKGRKVKRRVRRRR